MQLLECSLLMGNRDAKLFQIADVKEGRTTGTLDAEQFYQALIIDYMTKVIEHHGSTSRQTFTRTLLSNVRHGQSNW